jgi:hypothetical protein
MIVTILAIVSDASFMRMPEAGKICSGSGRMKSSLHSWQMYLLTRKIWKHAPEP